MTPTLPNWHSPRNETCQQNTDISLPCSCSKPQLARVRKPFRTVRVTDPHAPRGIAQELVITLARNGVITFREKGHRRAYSATAGHIFASLLWKEAREAAKQKKGKRK